MANSDTVIRNYAAEKPNRSAGGAVEWKASNVFCRGGVLYSYGTHFPLAVRLGSDRQGKRVYLKNGDRYSNTTSKHQRATRAACNGPTVPFSALRSALPTGDPGRLTVDNLLDWTEDLVVTLHRASKDAPWMRTDTEEPFKAPAGLGEISVYNRYGDGLIGAYHAPGCALFAVNGRHLLCTSDEGQYCVIHVPRPARTIEAAFRSLVPRPVIEARRRGIETRRQGEWFFVPTDAPEGASKARQAALPVRDDRSNRHVCVTLQTPRGLFARGGVFHRDPVNGRATRQHRALRLNTWHRAYRNLEVGSWTASGRVD